MSRSQIDTSNLIIRRANTQDLNKAIKISIVSNFVVLTPFVVIITSLLWYGINSLIVVCAVLIISLFLIIGIFAFTYNLGRLLGLLPKQHKNTHTWVAIYMDKRIGSADIDSQENFSVLVFLSINKGFHRKGVGTLLVQTVAEVEIKPLYVQPGRHVVSFYEKLGFTPINHRDLPPLLKKLNQWVGSKYMVLR